MAPPPVFFFAVRVAGVGACGYRAVTKPVSEGNPLNPKTITTVLLCTAALSACAKSSANIEASYVSPALYESMSCKQLSDEAQRVASRANTVAGVQDKNATRDAVATTAAAVIFWPAAFFIGGNGTNATELASLKGQLETIQSVSEQKNCGLTFRTVDPNKV